jgi:hypothetical protein
MESVNLVGTTCPHPTMFDDRLSVRQSMAIVYAALVSVSTRWPNRSRCDELA